MHHDRAAHNKLGSLLASTIDFMTLPLTERSAPARVRVLDSGGSSARHECYIAFSASLVSRASCEAMPLLGMIDNGELVDSTFGVPERVCVITNVTKPEVQVPHERYEVPVSLVIRDWGMA